MPAPVKPKKVQVNGRQSFWLVPSVADLTAPTVEEINAAGGINLSCTLLKSMVIAFQPTFNKVTLEATACEMDTFEANDSTAWTFPNLRGAFDPQAAVDSDDKKAFEFLADGFDGVLVIRNGKPADVSAPEAVAGEFFNLGRVSITPAADVSDGTSAANITTWEAGVAVLARPVFGVAATA